MKEAYRVHQHKRGLGLDSKIEIGAGGNAHWHWTCIGTDSFFVIASLCFHLSLEPPCYYNMCQELVVVPCSYLDTNT